METDHRTAIDSDKQQVTAVISHAVKPERQQEYEQWLHDISAVAQQFEGHCGVSFIRPKDPASLEYAIILKFDSYRNLKRWMDSPTRQSWIEKVKPLVQSDEDVQILTGFETWFTLPGRLIKQPPKRYKMAILTSLAVFAVSQLLGYVIGPLLQFSPGLLRALISVTLTVFLLTYVVMPRVTRLFYRWLYPKATRSV